MQYLADAIYAGYDYLLETLEVDQSTLEAISRAYHLWREGATTTAEQPQLRELKRILTNSGHENISYDTLKLGLAHLRQQDAAASTALTH